MRSDYRSIYIAFDPHPSYKGASTHIAQIVEVLAKAFSPLLLLTLPSNQDPVNTEAIDHLRFETEETNFFKRTTAFTQWARSIISQQHQLLVGHYRDPWGGLALSDFPHVHSVFEVNGLPSIELPYRYPDLTSSTLEKITALEKICLEQAVVCITPSHTTKRCLLQRGVAEAKVVVIPNGADPPSSASRPTDLPKKYMVYIGALQPWQGVEVLFKSFRYLEDVDLPLVICSSYTEHHAKPYRKFAEKLGVGHRVIWRYQLTKPDMIPIVQHALFSLAPLTECSRNVEQGCSPLKILESMACGTPVIASRLPAVEELITHNENGILCRPGRAADLARAIRLAVDYPAHLKTLGVNAQTHIRDHFTWDHAGQSLQRVYDNILTFSF